MLAPRSCWDWVSSCVGDIGGCTSGGTYVDGANEILVAHQYVGHGEAEEYGQDPSSHEAFDGLFGGELDQLRAAKGDAADVGEDVVSDDEGGGKEEPDHALEDVVHNEVCLHND